MYQLNLSASRGLRGYAESEFASHVVLGFISSGQIDYTRLRYKSRYTHFATPWSF